MNWNYTLFFILSTVCIGVESISNGTFISIKEAPFYVSIFPNKIFACGGSIISEYWILTAAHCFEPSVQFAARAKGKCVCEPRRVLQPHEVKKPILSHSMYRGYENIVITIGTGSSTKPTEGNLYVEKVIINEDYTPSYVGAERHDISLIKLYEPIVFNEFQQPIQIGQDPLKVGDKTTMYGLGRQGSTRTATLVLKKMELDILNQEECQSRMGPDYYLQSDVFCIGDGLTLPCPGDSGSPILVDGKLAGIASRGQLCRGRYRGRLSTHIRVHKYYDWIIKHTGIKY